MAMIKKKKKSFFGRFPKKGEGKPLVMLKVKNSNMHGRGVFADQDIKKGTKIIEYVGEKITHDEADRRGEKYDAKKCTYLFILNSRWVIDGAVRGGIARLINHSCDGNCEVISSKKLWIYAIKNIKKGEELFYDYRFEPAENKGDATMCMCAKKRCRGTIEMKRKSKS